MEVILQNMFGWIALSLILFSETDRKIEVLKDAWRETGRANGYEDGYRKGKDRGFKMGLSEGKAACLAGCMSCILPFPQVTVPTPPTKEIEKFRGKKPVLAENPTLEDIKAFYIALGYYEGFEEGFRKGFEDGYRNGYAKGTKEASGLLGVFLLGSVILGVLLTHI